MKLPRPIPKRVFQAMALTSLVPAVGLVAEVVVRDLPPYRWIADLTGSVVLGALLTLLLGVILWAVAIMPVRLLSKMPTLQEELDANEAKGLGELFSHQQAKLEKARDGRNPESRATYHGLMASGGAVVVLVSVVATLAAWFELGVLPVMLAAVAVVSVPLTLYHGVRFVIAKVRGAS